MLQLKEEMIYNNFLSCCYFSLSQGGTPPRFLIIDDGWQQITSGNKDANCVVQEGAQLDIYLFSLIPQLLDPAVCFNVNDLIDYVPWN